MKLSTIVFTVLLVTASGLFASGVYEIAAVTKIGRIDTGAGQGAAKTVAYSRRHRSLCIANPTQTALEIVSISVPSRPNVRDRRRVELSEFGASVDGLAIHDDLIAVAVGAEDVTSPGRVVFFDFRGRHRGSVEVGAGPGMLVFTRDGKRLLVANEGRPSDDYTVDPDGSVTIIGIEEGLGVGAVRRAGFEAFNERREELVCAGVRIFGPNATVAQDLEPQSIAVSEDSETAWISLQENNAIAELDIESGAITSIYPLGFKDHGKEGGGIDASDMDGGIHIRRRPVYGMYQPDSLAAFTDGGVTYLATANEGARREYDGYSEVARVADLELDPEAFQDAARLKRSGNLGRLHVTTTLGDLDGDGDYDRLYSFGGRSFSIWRLAGGALDLVYDSGEDFERITAGLDPRSFNCSGGVSKRFDHRSDDSGVEPEGIAVGYWLGQRYAFIGLKHGLGGVLIYNITDPAGPRFVKYVLSNDGSGRRGNDLSPGGSAYIHTLHAPEPYPILAVAYRHSGTVALYKFAAKEDEEKGEEKGEE